jgi:uncharacterized protein YndB with AHSA1/START domain
MTTPDTQQKMEVRQETRIKATPEHIWEVMTSMEGIKQWFGPSEYEPRQGGKIVFLVQESDQRWRMFGEIVTFDPPKQFALTWTEEVIGGETWPAATLVTITLTPENGHTRVTLVHNGFDRLPKALAEREFPGYVQGWQRRTILEGLKALVEGQ